MLELLAFDALSMFAPLLVLHWSEGNVLLTVLNNCARIKKTELLNHSHPTVQHIEQLHASAMDHWNLQRSFPVFAQGFSKHQCLMDSVQRLRNVTSFSWGNLSTTGAPERRYWSSWLCCSLWVLEHNTSPFISSGLLYAQSIWHEEFRSTCTAVKVGSLYRSCVFHEMFS